MKLIVKSAFILGFFLILSGLSSCGGKDNDENYAAEIEGTYIGQDYASEISKKSINQNITKSIGATAIITRESDKKISITYYNEGLKKSGADVQTIFKSVHVSRTSESIFEFSGISNSVIKEEVSGIVDGKNILLQIKIADLLVTDFRGTKSAL